MNFPLINTFQVGDRTIDFLNRKFDQYVSEQGLISAKASGDEVYVTDTGVFTNNMCLWEDEEFTRFVDWLVDLFAEKLDVTRNAISIHFTHFFDYQQGGLVNVHEHTDSEDFVMIVYTNTSESGDTIFYLNPKFKSRTHVSCKPTKGLAVLFSSMLQHEVKYTSDPKRIFVVGVRINTSGGV